MLRHSGEEKKKERGKKSHRLKNSSLCWFTTVMQVTVLYSIKDVVLKMTHHCASSLSLSRSISLTLSLTQCALRRHCMITKLRPRTNSPFPKEPSSAFWTKTTRRTTAFGRASSTAAWGSFLPCWWKIWLHQTARTHTQARRHRCVQTGSYTKVYVSIHNAKNVFCKQHWVNYKLYICRSLCVIRVVLLVPCLRLRTSPHPAVALFPVLLPHPLCSLRSPARPAHRPPLWPARAPLTGTIDRPRHPPKHPATVRNKLI